MNKNYHLVCGAVAAILTGCGGGDGGNSNQTPLTVVNNTAAPSVSLSTKTLDFKFQLQNKISAAKEVVLKNEGNAPLSLSGVSLTGADASMFAQTNDCGNTVAAGSSCTVRVTFSPTSGGAKVASVSFATNSSGSPHAVNLSGAGAEYGDVEELAATDACDLRTKRPNVQNGTYWFRHNPASKAFQTQANFTTAPKTVEIHTPREPCWMQFRRIPGTGGWYPFDDNLSGHEQNTEFAAEKNSQTSWSIDFWRSPSDKKFYGDLLFGDLYVLFMTGDETAWCSTTIGLRGEWPNQILVRDSSGVAVKGGSNTSILGSSSVAEYPFIGCEGTNEANQKKMLYGEAGSSKFTEFKNAHGGINVFVWFVPSPGMDSGGG